jgi:hypothetical protein
MVHGDFALQINDPETLILGLVGMRQADNDSFFGWFKQQVLKVIRDQTAELIVKQKWPLLDVVSGAYTEEIEVTVLQGVKKYVDHYGVRIAQMGNFVLSIKEEDESNLKKLYTDAAYVRMAGGMQGFQQFASGKAMMGAGEGMASGGGGGGEGEGGGGNAMLGGAALGVGFGMAGMMQQAGQAQGAPPAPGPGTDQAAPGDLKGTAPSAERSTGGDTVTCSECGKGVAPGKFCSECGAKLDAGPNFCEKCGGKLSQGAKFCPECGTKTGE